MMVLRVIAVGNSMAALIVALLFRYPVRTAFTVSAGLGRS
jgi:predicted Kef-type K+ transport protein